MRLAETAADWIRTDANAMDRSGRGGTGRAAAGVTVSSRSAVAFGSGAGAEAWSGSSSVNMVKGQVWWPWLEVHQQAEPLDEVQGLPHVP